MKSGSLTGAGGVESANASEYLGTTLGDRVAYDGIAGDVVLKSETPYIGRGDEPDNTLAAVQWICERSDLAWRTDDAAEALRISTPEDCLAACLADWSRLREDKLALADLRLSPFPDSAKLRAEDVNRWLDELGSADARHARVARAVLREGPDAVREEIARLAGAPGASKSLKTLGAVQALRSKARIAFVEYRYGDCYLWTARADGSEAKRVDGKLNPGHVIAGSSERRVVVQSWRKDFVTIDPERPAEIRSVRCAASDTILIAPDGQTAAVQDEAGIAIVDLETGKQTLRVEDSVSWEATWSRDGKALAWGSSLPERGGSTHVDYRSARDDDRSTYEFSNKAAWPHHLRCSLSSDGAYIAVVVRDEEILVVGIDDDFCDAIDPPGDNSLVVQWVSGTHAFLDVREGDVVLRFPDGTSWPIFESLGGAFSPVSRVPEP